MPAKKNKLFDELKKRKVYRVATVYAIAGWLIIQVADVTFPYLGLPEWLITALIVITLIGFPIAIVLSWIFELSPSGIVRTGSKKAKENPFPDRKKKPLTSAIAIVILLVLLAGQFIYFSFLREPGKEAQSATSTTVSMPSNSIAVLPFVNMSEEKDNQYFSDGVMEAVLNNLSMIHDLKVVSRTSVEKYRNQEKNITEIAEELEVANILEGSVQRIGDQVRVTAQLISAENDEHIWADSYDRRLTDIFAIQSEIAQTIAKNLEVIMTSKEIDLIKNAPTSNLMAYELWLKAWHMAGDTEVEVLEQINLVERSIDLDPEFGMAYSLKGLLLSNLAYYGYPESLSYDSAMKLQEIAIEKDQKIWYPHMVKANLFFLNHQKQQAVKSLQQTLELNPNIPLASERLGKYLLYDDEYEKAIDHLLKATTLTGGEVDHMEFNQVMGYFLYDLDKEQSYQHFLQAIHERPGNADPYHALFTCAMYFGEFDKMTEYAIEYRNLRPDLVNAANAVALSYLFSGKYEESELVYEEMLRATAGFDNIYMVFPFKHRLGYAKMMNGKENEGKKILLAHQDTLLSAIQQQQITNAGYGDYYDLALICAVLEQKDEAMSFLREARDHEKEGAFFRLEYILSDPMLDDLRDNPEFQGMVEGLISEQELITSLFHQKLKEYHARKELKWLKAG